MEDRLANIAAFYVASGLLSNEDVACALMRQLGESEDVPHHLLTAAAVAGYRQQPHFSALVTLHADKMRAELAAADFGRSHKLQEEMTACAFRVVASVSQLLQAAEFGAGLSSPQARAVRLQELDRAALILQKTSAACGLGGLRRDTTDAQVAASVHGYSDRRARVAEARLAQEIASTEHVRRTELLRVILRGAVATHQINGLEADAIQAQACQAIRDGETVEDALKRGVQNALGDDSGEILRILLDVSKASEETAPA